jgi:hypothetical protein
MHPPVMLKTDNNRENLYASSYSKPEIKAVETVIPILEIPGRIADACANPISNALEVFNLLLGLEYFVRYMIMPLVNMATPVERRFVKMISRKPLSNKLSITMGIVPSIKYFNIIPSLLEKFSLKSVLSRAYKSFLTKKITPAREPA